MSEFARALILETSSKSGQVALARAGQLVGLRPLPEARRHARDMPARTAELLAEQGWRARELTAIVVGIGPGSYTGLRVAAASAKALAFATGAALFGIPGFDAIASAATEEAEFLEIIGDAQQGQVYHQRFGRGTGGWTSQGPIGIHPFDEWVEQLSPGVLISGQAVAMYAERFPESLRLATSEERDPCAQSLLQAVTKNPRAYRSNAWELEPIYLRGSSAEEKRKREKQM
jgi:tRNA threonylcarbamoyladenosine biosynthesis protein TsaB